MKIIEVTSKSHKRDFNKIPFQIYKSDPHWIPHLKQDIEGVFDPKKNKVFRHGEACRWIVKEDDGTLLGRVAAFIDRKKKNYGFGFFESVNCQKVAFKLFDTCKSWLEERGGGHMEGPVNFGEKDKYWGLIIENFEYPPYYCQNYNPKYYMKFFEDYGFQIYYEQYIYYRKAGDPMQQKYIDRAKRIAKTPGFTIESINKKNLFKYAEDFRLVYNSAWANRDGKEFKGMPAAQAKSIMKQLKAIIDEDLTWFAYYEGQPIGFYISLPEINQIFKHINGNLNWWGKLKFLYHKWKGTCTSSFGIAFGIDPKFQGRGVEGAIFNAIAERIQPKKKYDDVIITWIGDFNPKMINVIESLGTQRLRRLATYRKLFDENKPFERYPIKNKK